MNPTHISYKTMDAAVRTILRAIKKDIEVYGVEGAYDLLHARNEEVILRQQMKVSMTAEEAIAACALFGALQYVEALFMNQEIENATKMA